MNTPGKDPNTRFMLLRLTTEIAEGLEDVRYHRQKRERRRVTKRSLVEEALQKLISAEPSR
ncbi:MAG: hypothetical protein ACYC8T_27660 [Myxococcaceae bacterium]